MKTIKVLNSTSLSNVGPVLLRKDAIDIIEKAIQAADPYQAAKKLARLEGDCLKIDSLSYDLRNCKNVYVIGAGKATQSIALALEEVLGDWIAESMIVLKRGEQNHLKRIRTLCASHPIPDQVSLQAGRELMSIACKAGRGDIVISIVTGGSSSLAILPPEGVTLADVQELYKLLLASGASIFEINAVRKHVSQIKGGRLAQKIFPAQIVNLTVSDVVGDALDYITDLTVPDTSHYYDAWEALNKYHLWDKIPASIRKHLRNGFDTESPKSFNGVYHTIVVVPGDAAFQGAVNRCRELGYCAHLYPKEIEGESRDEAKRMVAFAKGYLDDSPNSPFAIIATGETTVTIDGPHGCGGPNQEFALSAAVEINGWREMAVAAIDVDGTDGPTDMAGALTDGGTVQRAKFAGLDAGEFLDRHSSLDILKATNDLVYTGPTGTNVNDIMFILSDQNQSRHVKL